jgi:hypothetical protein
MAVLRYLGACRRIPAFIANQILVAAAVSKRTSASGAEFSTMSTCRFHAVSQGLKCLRENYTRYV